MTVSVVQSQSAGHDDGGGHTTVTATFDDTPTNGNTLVAVVALYAPVTSKSVNTPSGWTARTPTGGEWTDPQTMAIFSKVSNGTETGATVTFDSVLEDVIHIYEVDGAWADYAHLFGGGSSLTVPTVTPDAGLDVLLIVSSAIRAPYNVNSGPAGYTLFESEVYGVRLSGWSKAVDPTTGGGYSGTISYAGSGYSHRVQMYFTGVAPAPVADFEAVPTSGPVPLTVDFTDLSSGTPTSWAWTFGDGGTSTSQHPTHVYSVAGVYTVGLTATNAAGSDVETKLAYISVTADVGYEPPAPAQALIEIYAAEAGAARWDEATWDDAVWSQATWQDVTPQSVEAVIVWGSRRPERGILSRPDAGSWTIDIYDPDRVLDPANADGQFFTDLIPGLPVRVSHRGLVIRQGIAESIGHSFSDDRGRIRVQDNIAVLANAEVPSDTTLSDTLFARAVDAIAAAGLGDSIRVLPAPSSGDPDVAEWVTGVNEWSAWQWISDAAEQALHVPYIDRVGRLGFRAWASPLARARELNAEELVGLTSLTQFNGMFSEVSALDSVSETVETRALTPPPRYGVRAYVRTDPTLDAGDWATAVLTDRAFSALRWIPGTMYPLTADSVELLATIEAVELVGLVHGYTTPEVLANLIIVGGTIRLTARRDDEAQWWFTFEAAQTALLPLSTEDGTGFLLNETETEYLYPDA